MKDLPTGTVTFLFADIEGSTALLQQLTDAHADILMECRRLVRSTVQERGGHEVGTQGDAVFAAFPSAREAVLAAVAAQKAILRNPWPSGAGVKVRMGLHTGEARVAEDDYVGLDVHRAARICAAGHGGQILISDTVSALVTKDLPEGISLRDLGEHRLKDLAHPHRLFQVVAPDLPADFPPLKSLSARPNNNLPVQLTSFIGREREIAEVKRLLGAARLVTLTGSGGAGKTRLALQVAADMLGDYPDGVWLAELAPIADATLVSTIVASAMNVPEQPGREIVDTLVDALRPKTVSLVLDNCEHLLTACRDLAVTLLRNCAGVRILATSREALGVPGETVWRVPSLSVPEGVSRLARPEELVRYDAVRLFIDRALATAPGFAITRDNAPAVAQVCQRLDGIPLAIELAAARVKVLAVEQIAARLDDRFRLLSGGSTTLSPRQQTLRATIDWSYKLLSVPEQALLRRLSVFAGGWALETAEAICSGEGVESSHVLDLLTSLVDKSLVFAEVQHGAARYRLLETLRQYGEERLSEAGETNAVRRRHRDWYLERAGHFDRARTEDQEVRIERLRTEHDNFRAALQWSMEIGDGEAAAQLATALSWFWYIDGHWGEGRKWLERALAISGDVRPATLAALLMQLAYHVRSHGDYKSARAFAERGLTIARATNNKVDIAWFLYNLGVVAVQEGDFSQGKALCEESVALARQLGAKFLLANALAQLGHIARENFDYEQASTFYGESVTVARQYGEKYTIAYALRNMAVLALHIHDYTKAGALFAQSLALCRTAPNWVTEECLVGMAEIACAERRYERAVCLFGAGDVLRETLGVRRSLRMQKRLDENVSAARAGLGDNAFSVQWARGRAMTLEQAIEYALAAEGN